MSLLEQVEGKDYDDRSVAERMRDLGVKVIKKNVNEVTDVKWVDGPNISKISRSITITKKAVYFPGLMDDLDKVALGTGKYRGKMVLVVKADPKGYKVGRLTGRGTRRYSIGVKKVTDALLSAGLKPGLYEPIKIKGGWMGVPEEVDE